MPHFEVFIPAKDADSFNLQLTVQAPNWLGALRTGLANIGEGPQTISNILCDIKEDSSIHVTDPASNRVFRIREVPGPGAAAPPPPAPPPPPVAAAPAAPVAPPKGPAKTQLFAPGVMPQPPAAVSSPPPPAVAPPPPAPVVGPPPPAPVVASPPPASVAPPPAPVLAPPPAPVATPAAPVAAQKPPPQASVSLVPAVIPQKGAQPAQSVSPALPVSQNAAPASGSLPPAAKGGDGSGKTSKPGKSGGEPAPSPSKPSKTVSEMAAVRKVENQFQTAPQPVQRAETKERPPAPIGRLSASTAPPPFTVEDVLSELFEKMQDVYAGSLDKERIANALLDMAMNYVKSDAGTFYTVDLSGYELEFTAVRGPKAKEIVKQKLKVPVGQGIVGFCAQEGVSLAISDVPKDPRFAASISERIGYPCRNMVCAPLYKEGRLWGALQLINRLGADSFHAAEMDVVNYIAHEGASLLTAAEG